MEVNMDKGYIYFPCNVKNWKQVTSFVDKKDVYEGEYYGIADDPHISICYNVNDDEIEKEKIDRIVEELEKRPEVTVTGIGMFSVDRYEGDSYDVLHYKVESEDLKKIQKKIYKSVCNKDCMLANKFHITIAYLHPSQASKYVKDIKPFSFELKKLVYQDADKNKHKVDILNLITEKGIYNKQSKIMRISYKDLIKEDFEIGKIKVQPSIENDDETGIHSDEPVDGKEYAFDDVTENPYHENLPQVTAPFHFIVQNLNDLKVDFKPVKVKAGSLSAMQKDVGADAVNDISHKIMDGHEMPPIWISKDNHICDGHHRAAGTIDAHGKDSLIKAIKVDAESSSVPHILGRIQDRWDLIKDDKSRYDMAHEFDKYFQDEVVDGERKFSYDELAID